MNDDADRIRRCVAGAVQKFAGEPGPLLEILHAIQDELGFVPAAAVPQLAQALNLSRAEIHGVITFYHHFRAKAPGRFVVQLCRAEACQSMNARALEEFIRGKLRLDFGETTPDGRITLEPVYCLGNCACAPALMVNGELHGRVTPERAAEIIKEWGVA
ncbi:MAG TPA: formate dehydrogenase subunit gamma [Steroidobacteraceae bacterium]|nr:formate dehydrogenase subunit gamma [Steroidobacteraceae bacterium]